MSGDYWRRENNQFLIFIQRLEMNMILQLKKEETETDQSVPRCIL